MSVDTNDTQAGPFSSDGSWQNAPDGRWVWDGQRWAPLPNASGPAISPPVLEARSLVPGIALALGIVAIVVGLALWIFAASVQVSRTNDLIVTTLLTFGFVPGQLAVIFGLGRRARSRSRVSVAALICGLVGLAVTFLWVAFTILNF